MWPLTSQVPDQNHRGWYPPSLKGRWPWLKQFFVLLLVTPCPTLLLPMKVFHFVQLLRAPFYLQDEIQPHSWIVEKRQSDIQIYSVEIYFLTNVIKMCGCDFYFERFKFTKMDWMREKLTLEAVKHGQRRGSSVWHKCLKFWSHIFSQAESLIKSGELF